MRRFQGFFVTWLRIWGMTGHYGGWHLVRRARWTFIHWNANGRGRHFVS